MLNRPDYRDGGILASIEKDLKEFLDTLPKNCDDMALLKSKWNRIRYVSARYARFMEMFAKTGVTSENPLYTTTVKASVEIILIAGKVKEWMEHCAAFQQIPGLGGIVKTNRILDSDCPDPSSAASDNSEDRAIRNKILYVNLLLFTANRFPAGVRLQIHVDFDHSTLLLVDKHTNSFSKIT